MMRLGGYQLRHYLGGTELAPVWQAEAGDQRALVFVLPAAHLSQAQPELSQWHSALLPLTESGVEEVADEADTAHGRAAYLIAPLPQGAEPLRDLRSGDLPILLDALATLHEARAVHGGVRPELLWRGADGRPLLAGAGVPWQTRADTTTTDSSPAQDVRHLAQALAALPLTGLATDWPFGSSASQLTTLQGVQAGETAVTVRQRLNTPVAPADAPSAFDLPLAEEAEPLQESQPIHIQPVPVQTVQSQPVQIQFAAQPPHPPKSERLSRLPWVLLVLALAGLLGGTTWATRFLQVPHAPAEEWPCCTVQFVLPSAGAKASAVRLRVLDGPPLLTLPPELRRGVPLPETLNLPGPGQYRLRLSAEGYAPQTVTVTAPSPQPIEVRLD